MSVRAPFRARGTAVRQRGFTLVELLAVIAILALLAALLFPALNSAMYRAKQAACLSNHRQLGAAIITFAAGDDGRLPPHGGFLYGFKNADGTGSGLGKLYEQGYLQDLRLALCPGYASVEPPDYTYGSRGWFNGYRNAARKGTTFQDLFMYCFPSIYYSTVGWPAPAHWALPNPPQGWASSDPNLSHRLSISDDYLKTFKIRTACAWNALGGVGMPPSATSRYSHYCHGNLGVNVGMADGSALWIPGDVIVGYMAAGSSWHSNGHWRDYFWRSQDIRRYLP